MTAPIEDISDLPGKKISDQEAVPIGEVKEIYATEDGFPMWVVVETSEGMGDKQIAVIPLARLKEEGGEIRVPYSKSHITDAPEIGDGDEISDECDRELRVYYGIGTGDQEMWSDNKGYATLVPEEMGAAKKVDNTDDLEMPDDDKRTDESKERVQDPGSSEMRKVDAEDVASQGADAEVGDEKGEGGGDGDQEGEEDREEDGDQQGGEDQEKDGEPKGEEDQEKDGEPKGEADRDQDEQDEKDEKNGEPKGEANREQDQKDEEDGEPKGEGDREKDDKDEEDAD